VIDLSPIARLRRLGAAGSEQSVARTLTDAITRPIQRATPGCDASGPAVFSRNEGPEEPSYAETPDWFRGAGPRWCTSTRLS
jgi:hypothetical protein